MTEAELLAIYQDLHAHPELAFQETRTAGIVAERGVQSEDEFRDVLRSLPSNHSPRFAPVPEPTLTVGVQALVQAVRAW